MASTSVILAVSAALGSAAWSTTGHSTTTHRLGSGKKDLPSDKLRLGTIYVVPTQDGRLGVAQSTVH